MTVEERLAILEKALITILKDEVLNSENMHTQLIDIVRLKGRQQKREQWFDWLGLAICLLFCFLIALALDFIVEKEHSGDWDYFPS